MMPWAGQSVSSLSQAVRIANSQREMTLMTDREIRQLQDEEQNLAPRHRLLLIPGPVLFKRGIMRYGAASTRKAFTNQEVLAALAHLQEEGYGKVLNVGKSEIFAKRVPADLGTADSGFLPGGVRMKRYKQFFYAYDPYSPRFGEATLIRAREALEEAMGKQYVAETMEFLGKTPPNYNPSTLPQLNAN